MSFIGNGDHLEYVQCYIPVCVTDFILTLLHFGLLLLSHFMSAKQAYKDLVLRHALLPVLLMFTLTQACLLLSKICIAQSAKHSTSTVTEGRMYSRKMVGYVGWIFSVFTFWIGYVFWIELGQSLQHFGVTKYHCDIFFYLLAFLMFFRTLWVVVTFACCFVNFNIRPDQLLFEPNPPSADEPQIVIPLMEGIRSGSSRNLIQKTSRLGEIKEEGTTGGARPRIMTRSRTAGELSIPETLFIKRDSDSSRGKRRAPKLNIMTRSKSEEASNLVDLRKKRDQTTNRKKL